MANRLHIVEKIALQYEEYKKEHPLTRKTRSDPLFTKPEHNKAEKPESPSPHKKPQEPEQAVSKKPSVTGDPKQDHEVASMLDKLKSIVDEAKAKGEKSPNFDLCQISVPGTNLFCGMNKGIPRQEMPQLKGKPAPGTPASKLQADPSGEVSIEKNFVEELKNKGVKLSKKSLDASELKATQNQLVGPKVVGMLSKLEKNPNDPDITAPIFVSKDGYVLDGHHRWAAMVGLNFKTDKPVRMNVIEVDMSIDDLVKFTNDFADSMGIRQKAARKLWAKILALETQLAHV